MFKQKQNPYCHVLSQMVLHGSLHDNFSILYSYSKSSGRLAFYSIAKYLHLMCFKGFFNLRSASTDLERPPGAFIGCSFDNCDGLEPDRHQLHDDSGRDHH